VFVVVGAKVIDMAALALRLLWQPVRKRQDRRRLLDQIEGSYPKRADDLALVTIAR
jgi:hypothetical protein